MRDDQSYSKLKKMNKKIIEANRDFLTSASGNGFNLNPLKVSVKISGIYVLIGCLWILFSEKILYQFIKDAQTIATVSMIKGWGFVLATGFLTYMLVYRTMGRIRKTEQKVVESYAELSATYEELEASFADTSKAEEMLKQQYDELQKYSGMLEISEDRLKRAQTLAKVGNWELDLKENSMWASEQAFRLYGLEYVSTGIPYVSAHEIVHPDDRERLENALKALLEENAVYDLEFRVIDHKRKEERIIHSVAQLENSIDGKPKRVLGVIQDITESRRNQEAVKHLAYYDGLTDLPNKLLFTEKLQAAMKTALKNDEKIALVVFDISNFKKINDLLGHIIGDELLKAVSERLQPLILERSGILARFTGDEFAFFIEEVKERESIKDLITQLLDVSDQPFHIKNYTISISTSFGIAIFPEQAEAEDLLLKNADTAKFKAKEAGRNMYKFYDDNIREEVHKRICIENYLQGALNNNELYLCYQPQVDTKSRRLRGIEALLRWNCPRMGRIPPMEFISIAEETGMIVEIGEWVLEKACAANKIWQDIYKEDMIISVNISPVELKQKNFADKVKDILKKTGLNPELLELEITENVLIESFEFVEMLEDLKKIGVKISLDDFGTGYSSLNYLTKLPINTLKIDKSFLDAIKTDRKQKDVIESIISLIHKIGLEVIAEGVETNDQLDYLINSACDSVQGYLISKPLEEKQLAQILENGPYVI